MSELPNHWSEDVAPVARTAPILDGPGCDELPSPWRSAKAIPPQREYLLGGDPIAPPPQPQCRALCGRRATTVVRVAWHVTLHVELCERCSLPARTA
jgi:hypothetical protein